MLLSIIVPVYNIEPYILKALNSVKSQTYSNFECIIIDDGSTDKGGEIAKQFCKDDPRFKYYYKQNGGLVSAWKHGLEKSSGKYIFFLDGDDFLIDSCLETLYEPIKKYNVDVSMGNFFYYFPDRDIAANHSNNIKSGLYTINDIYKIHEGIFPKVGFNYISPARWGKLIRRSILIENLKYSDSTISSGEDTNIIVPVFLSCKSFHYTDTPLLYYVQRKLSISHKFNENNLDKYVLLISILKKAAKDKNFDISKLLPGLYNSYGICWSIYVANSNLKLKEKIKHIKRLYDIPDFYNSSKSIIKKQGNISLAYKATLKHKAPLIFLMAQYLLKIKIRLKDIVC